MNKKEYNYKEALDIVFSLRLDSTDSRYGKRRAYKSLYYNAKLSQPKIDSLLSDFGFIVNKKTYIREGY